MIKVCHIGYIVQRFESANLVSLKPEIPT